MSPWSDAMSFVLLVVAILSAVACVLSLLASLALLSDQGMTKALRTTSFRISSSIGVSCAVLAFLSLGLATYIDHRSLLSMIAKASVQDEIHIDRMDEFPVDAEVDLRDRIFGSTSLQYGITLTPVNVGADCLLSSNILTFNLVLPIRRIVEEGLNVHVISRATIPERRWLVQVPMDQCPNARMLITTEELGNLARIKLTLPKVMARSDKKKMDADKAALIIFEHNQKEAESALRARRP